MFSFLSKSLTKILVISNLIFLASTGLFAYKSYSLTSDLARVEQILDNCSNANLSLQNSLKQQELSCKADDTAVAELTSENKELTDKMNILGKKIESLTKPTYHVPNGTQEGGVVQQENVKNEVNIVPNSALLSDELVSLLKQSFCTIEPDDSYCSP